MSKINIPQGDFGKVRVFAMSLPDSDAQALRDTQEDAALAQLLGVADVDAAHVDVLRVSDLGEIGLAGYLREGLDAPDAALMRDSVKLASIDGWALLVHSTAFGGQAAALDPAPELTFIGTYALTQADHAQTSLESDAAAPYTGVPNLTPKTPPKGSAGGSMVVVGLVVLVVLVLWWAFS